MKNVACSTWSNSGPMKTNLMLSAGELSLEMPGQSGRHDGSMDFWEHFNSLGHWKTISKVASQATLAPAPHLLGKLDFVRMQSIKLLNLYHRDPVYILSGCEDLPPKIWKRCLPPPSSKSQCRPKGFQFPPPLHGPKWNKYQQNLQVKVLTKFKVLCTAMKKSLA